MRIIRWLLLLPSAVIAGVAASAFAFIPLGIAHGFNRLLDLLNAADMAGMYFVGTYSLLMIRGAMGAASTWTVGRVAPSHGIQFARVWLGILIVVTVALVAVLNFALERADAQLTFSAGWRLIVETAGIVGGSWLALNLLKGEIAE